MTECTKLSKQEVVQKISEILIQTQFAHFIEPETDRMTAEQVNTMSDRAVDYYLGKDSKTANQGFIMKKFNSLINMQRAMIMRALDDYDSNQDKAR